MFWGKHVLNVHPEREKGVHQMDVPHHACVVSHQRDLASEKQGKVFVGLGIAQLHRGLLSLSTSHCAHHKTQQARQTEIRHEFEDAFGHRGVKPVEKFRVVVKHLLQVSSFST